jgi:hypothetical protein
MKKQNHENLIIEKNHEKRINEKKMNEKTKKIIYEKKIYEKGSMHPKFNPIHLKKVHLE